MTPDIPFVEITRHQNGFGIRRPDREPDARDAVDGGQMRAEGLPGFVESAFAVEIQIEFGDYWRKAIRVVEQ